MISVRRLINSPAAKVMKEDVYMYNICKIVCVCICILQIYSFVCTDVSTTVSTRNFPNYHTEFVDFASAATLDASADFVLHPRPKDDAKRSAPHTTYPNNGGGKVK